MPIAADPSSATRTPKGVSKDIKADVPNTVVASLKASAKDNHVTGADIARALVDAGIIDPATTRNPGLVIRTYMRSHGAYVGQGRTYNLTVGQATTIAAGYIAKVAPADTWHRGVKVIPGEDA